MKNFARYLKYAFLCCMASALLTPFAEDWVLNAQSAYPVPFLKAQWFDANGAPLASGCLYTYAAGTTTLKTSYTTSGLVGGLVANANPVVLDAAGRANVWLASGPYRIDVYSAGCIATGTLLWSIDNIPGFTSAGGVITTNGISFSSDCLLVGVTTSSSWDAANCLDVNGRAHFRSKAVVTPSTGVGVDLWYDSAGATGNIGSFDWGAGAMKPLLLNASVIKFLTGTTPGGIADVLEIGTNPYILDVFGRGRFKSATVTSPSAGAGLDLFYEPTTGSGVLMAADWDQATNKLRPLTLEGSDVVFRLHPTTPSSVLEQFRFTSTGQLVLTESTVNPSGLTAGSQVAWYMKSDKLVLQINSSGTPYYLTVSLAGVTTNWTWSASAP